ncbi:hypothetical protein GCM10018773_35160 [Streptomyces candidus]|nr:hypothetical protein GCM10018773_35160 [Streptomyces candidus]
MQVVGTVRKSAREATIVGLTGAAVLLGGALAPVAQAVDGGRASMRVCANTAGKWQSSDAKALGDCHTARGAYASKRAELIRGKVPGKVAESWGAKAAGESRSAVVDGARRTNGPMTSGEAVRAAMWAAVASDAARPVEARSGSAESATATGDEGYRGAVLEARRAARAAWRAAESAHAAGGRDTRRNIEADRAESKAWQTARTAGWLE